MSGSFTRERRDGREEEGRDEVGRDENADNSADNSADENVDKDSKDNVDRAACANLWRFIGFTCHWCDGLRSTVSERRRRFRAGIGAMRGIEQTAMAFAHAGRARSDGRVGVGWGQPRTAAGGGATAATTARGGATPATTARGGATPATTAATSAGGEQTAAGGDQTGETRGGADARAPPVGRTGSAIEEARRTGVMEPKWNRKGWKTVTRPSWDGRCVGGGAIYRNQTEIGCFPRHDSRKRTRSMMC
ncbi:hypothetical protein N6G06_10485 [Cupriavidus gilardii]|uniref:hypothetical protein n=1 Tax=Cupriavidus gilardii TaxID=82541 RepID=UPI0021BE99A7|nr:hypothetical protein [Cupriavidus gilardii]MCT9071792.1 hypothetical protein [Cupriavidus gilardii]